MYELQHVHTKSVCRVFSHSRRSPAVSICYPVFPPFPVFPVLPVCVCVWWPVPPVYRAHLSEISSLFPPLCTPASHHFVSLQLMYSSVVSPPRRTRVRTKSYCLFAVFFPPSPYVSLYLMLVFLAPQAHLLTCQPACNLPAITPPLSSPIFLVSSSLTPRQPPPSLRLARSSLIIAPLALFLFPINKPLLHQTHQLSLSSAPGFSTRSLLVQQSNVFILPFGYSQLLMLEWKDSGQD